MIVVTGAAGFIGSCTVSMLNDQGIEDIIVVDEFDREDKNVNLEGKSFRAKVHRDHFPGWLWENFARVEFIYHLGARTDTTEQDETIFWELNLDYSKTIWVLCTQHNIPLVYASSAATYGLGERGYKDRHDIIKDLEPLNPYGRSKNDFDIWALAQKEQPPFWAGLKFFNVYGPNEYHKGRMASVIFHTVRQIKATGGMKLFRSHKEGIKDGEQSRDFIYVKDVLNILWFFHQHQEASGLYNVGTGKARTFYDLAASTFHAMDLEPNISFIDTPEDIRDTYQYFTEADMEKLKTAGYEQPFYTLEEGIRDYVQGYLLEEKIF
ncbi:MAG TPA: ADP-glyceromanno-heptose 6-epimerase [Saprospiraceae bacterium]|nr:ADP-glyceromanno-heptose 6-epimerase [Saprospiraceae bacterium]